MPFLNFVRKFVLGPKGDSHLLKREESYQEFFEKDTSIINYLADGLLVFDENNKLILINPQAEKFLEVIKDNVLGRPFLNLHRFPNFKPLISLLGGEIRKFSRKELGIKKDFTLEVTVIPIMAAREKIGSIVVLHDISREKLVEKMKSEFVALAAHRLRTPSSAIKWVLAMLLEGDYGELTDKQREVIKKTYTTNDKMIKLINDLLNVAKIEEGRFLTKITLSSIEEVIQSVADTFQERMRERKLKFELKKPEKKLAAVMLDIEKMEIAIENILDNAVRYSLPGGKITLTLKSGKKEIEVQIQDTGVGIPEEQREKVFTKFFRGANVIRMETEGTGLGLFTSKNIIEAHGGRIWFKSEEGRGTTFCFTIPVREQFGEFLTEEFY